MSDINRFNNNKYLIEVSWATESTLDAILICVEAYRS